MPCAFHAERPYLFRELGPGCQFGVAEARLVRVGKELWCPFHLPLEDAEKKPTEKKGWNTQRIWKFNEGVFAFIEKAKKEGRDADLTGVIFPGDISFVGFASKEIAFPDVCFFQAHFGGGAGFYEAHFGGDAGFREVRFADVAAFREAHFGGDAGFREAHFGGDALFEHAHFGGDASFYKANFGGVAGFREAHFGGDAVFEKAQFDSDASFYKANFGGDVWFGNAHFGVEVNFDEAHFGGDAQFVKAHFLHYASFAGVPEDGSNQGGAFEHAEFSRATFKGAANFSNRRFLKATDFSACVFHEAPKFHNSRLHQDTDFADAKFFDFESDGAARAYRTLKLAMENVRAWDEAGMFFAFEQQSRRHEAETPRMVKAFSLLYEITADYGRSFALPLGWLLGATAAFYLVYLAGITGGEPTWDGAAEAASFTLRQIVRPFDALASGSVAGANPVRLTLGLRALAALHSLLSLAFVALFLVALRRRFKMG